MGPSKIQSGFTARQHLLREHIAASSPGHPNPFPDLKVNPAVGYLSDSECGGTCTVCWFIVPVSLAEYFAISSLMALA